MTPKLLAALSCFGLLYSGISFAEQIQEKHLTILHTNDHHGRFWKDNYSQLGMAARKSLIDSIRAKVKSNGGEVLLLSGGDINTGVPESDMQYAKPDFLGMKQLGYDAMAVGNHEFDVPYGVMRMQQIWSQVPFLSANIYNKKTNARLFAPYKIFNFDHLRVAVVGLTTTDTLRVGSSSLQNMYSMTDPTDEFLNIKNELDKLSPDIVIGLTHMGHYENGNHGSNAYGDVKLAQSLPSGTLDAIIGGHSQNVVCYSIDLRKQDGFKPGDECWPDKKNGVWIMQAQEWGRFVGRADFVIKGDSVNLTSYRLIPINLKHKVKVDGKSEYVLYEKEIPQDVETEALLKPYFDRGNNLINYKIADSAVRLIGDRDQVRHHQTNLGQAIADSMMEKTNASLAIMNSGGVRDSIEAGEVTYRDVLKVLPWGNTIVTVELSGLELQTYLSDVLAKTPGSGGYAQHSSNLTLADGVVQINGKNIDNSKIYKLSLPSYASRGGDNYPKLDSHPNFVDTGYVDADVLKEFLMQK